MTFYCRGIEILSSRFYQPLFHIDFIWKRTKKYKQLCELTDYGHQIVGNVLWLLSNTIIHFFI